MTIHELSAAGTAQGTAPTAPYESVEMSMVAAGSATTSGTAELTEISAATRHVTQVAGQADVTSDTPRRVTLVGLNTDDRSSVERYVTQVNAQADARSDVDRYVTQVAGQADARSDVERRVSDAGLLVDGRWRRPVLTTDLLEFHIYDRYGNYLDYLDNATAKVYEAEMSEPGAGAFQIPATDSKAGTATIYEGCVVKVRYRNVDVGAWVVEDVMRPLVVQEGQEDEIVNVQGRGLLALLEKGVIYPADIGDTSTAIRSYTGQTAAAIFLDLYAEFEARGGGDLGTDFNATHDSDSVAWSDSQTEDFRAGQSMLDVARHMAGVGAVEWTVDPDKTLQAWVHAGGTVTNVQFAEGKNILWARRVKDSKDLANAVLAEGQGLMLEVTDSDSISSYGRREMYLMSRNSAATAQVGAAGTALVTELSGPVDTIEMAVTTEHHRPFIDYELGSTVRVDIPDEIDNSDYRVRSISLAERTSPRDLIATLQLNSSKMEYVTKLVRAIETARNVPATGAAGQNLTAGDTRASAMEGHTHTESDITDLDHDAVKLQSRAVGTAAPSDGQGLTWDDGASEWAPADVNAIRLQNRNVSASAPSDTQVLAWDAAGSAWAPANAGGTSSAGTVALAAGGWCADTDITYSSSAYAWKGNYIKPFNDTRLYALGVKGNWPQGISLSAKVLTVSGSAIASIVGSAGTVVLPASLDTNPSEAVVWAKFGSPVTLTAGSSYLLAMGCTSGADDYALPCVYPSRIGQVSPIPSHEMGTLSGRIALADPTVGGTVNDYAAGIVGLYALWEVT